MLGAATLLAGCSTFDSLTGSGGDEPAQSDIPTALIVDGSGSMNTDDASGTRIDAAKTAAGAYIDALPDGTDFSLWTYGLNTSDSEADHDAGCQDTTNLIDSGDVDRDAAKNAVNGIAPRGWSPIAATMKQAGESLPTDVEASLVVVTDGEDHCGRPTICEVAEQLHESHPMLRIDAIGFMIDDDELNCAATTTGGLYVTADNTEQLTSRLAASRDTELSKTTLTGRSFQGIEIGASHERISAAFSDFPALSEGTETVCTSGDCGSDTITIVNWRDCDWHFTDAGILQLIDPGDEARTIDGFGVGDDADELATFYGDVIEESTGTLDGDDVTIRWYE
ncbi:MAG TPA: VWA domain-containing protein, partial [Corynebacterium sp.]|uniref:VWA domain-containing protein n=1 Tax=Corynebacterium sp. TaxID=1720 RepID=UPI00180E0CCB